MSVFPESAAKHPTDRRERRRLTFYCFFCVFWWRTLYPNDCWQASCLSSWRPCLNVYRSCCRLAALSASKLRCTVRRKVSLRLTGCWWAVVHERASANGHDGHDGLVGSGHVHSLMLPLPLSLRSLGSLKFQMIRVPGLSLLKGQILASHKVNN